MKPYYEDDACRIYLGDCREVLPSLPKCDLLVTDPPYGINYQSGRGNHEAIAGDVSDAVALEAIPLSFRQLKFKRHFYVFGPFDLSALTEGATMELIWDKGKFSSGNLALPWGAAHERVTFGVWTPYPSDRGSGARLARLRRGTVLHHPTPNNGRGALEHPTRKPVAMLREFIEASSLFGETVLDPFMGSGSTLVAARLEGRKAIGIELEERYCEIAAQKLSQGALNFGGAA